MKLLLSFVALAAIAAADIPKMIKNKQRRELYAYIAVFLVVLAFAVLVSLDIDMPSPVKTIQSFYRDILHLSFKTS